MSAKKRVLIVDDQAAFRGHLSQLLRYVGLEVVAEVSTILEAERAVCQHYPDLAVVDVMLPGGINGIPGTAILKAAAPGMRVILVSAYTDQADVFHNAAYQVGADFISKDELDIDLVRSWLEE